MKDSKDILNDIRNMPNDNSICDMNKGNEREKQQYDEDPEAWKKAEMITRNILLTQMQKGNHPFLNNGPVTQSNVILAKTTFQNAFESLKLNAIDESKYSLSYSEIISADDTEMGFHIWVEPKEAIKIKSKLGEIGISYIKFTIKLSITASSIIFEILSHFNPDFFDDCKVEYLDIVTTGTHRHVLKEFEVLDADAALNIKSGFDNWIKEGLGYYFK